MQLLKVVFDVSGEKTLKRIERLRGKLTPGQFLQQGGRPPALSTADLAAAKAMLRDPEITVAQVAARLKVSAATLYCHLPGGRGGVLPSP